MTKKLKILVLEDDPALTTLLKTVLQNQGHHVLTFADPTKCLELNINNCGCSQEFRCADVIISDIVMPQMTGVEFFDLQRERGCKALDANKALMSAANTEVDAEVERLGCHFFHKPFKLADLLLWIEECATRISLDCQPSGLGN